MTVEGIDISHHQTQTPPLGTSLGFVFVRACYGLSVDDKYAMHAANVTSAHKVLGAYHFGRYGSGKAQASAFLNTIGKAVHLVALDYERDGDNAHMTPGQAGEFIRSVQASGRKCGLYASDSGYPDLGQDWNWVARWGDEPKRQYAFWQYDNGSNPLNVDRDRFAGTMEQLHVLAGYPIHYTASVPMGTALRLFDVEAGVVKSVRTIKTDHAMVARHCSAPRTYKWPGHLSRRLVKLDSDGPYINAKYATAKA